MLKNIEIRYFRNLEIKKTPIQPVVFIVGENRSGKTNFLESIHYLAWGRSFRKGINKTLIKEGFSFARIAGEVEEEKNVKKIETILIKENDQLSKKIRINGVFKKDIIPSKFFAVVSFIPQDINLPILNPSQRRKYFNNLIFKIDQNFLNLLKSYKKIIQSKNIILKENKNQLDFWNEQLAITATKIYLKRKEILEKLNKLFPIIYSRLFGEKIDLKIDYRTILSGENEKEAFDNFLLKLQKEEKKEREKGYSLFGTHRDDFLFLLNNRPLFLYSSEGEKRLSILALKFGELKLLEDFLGLKPTLLLDDVFSELDKKRRDLLCSLMKRQQTITTTTDLGLVDSKWYKDAQIIKIKEGKLVL